MSRLLLITPVWLLAMACGSSREPIPALLDGSCWVDDGDSDLLVDVGTAYLLDHETGTRYADGDHATLERGNQGQYHISYSLEVVGDLELTSEAEAKPRTRLWLYDASGELLSTSCNKFMWYEPGGQEGLVLEYPTFIVVSPAYDDILIGHSATLVVKTLDIYGHVASGQVELAIDGQE